MPKRLTTLYLKALDLSRASLADVATGTRRGYRTLQAVRFGEFNATPTAGRTLAGYLRRRAQAFTRAAEELERAAAQEEERT